MPNPCHLEISSWTGISIGASHYYGRLLSSENRYTAFELHQVLTESKARQLNVNARKMGEDSNFRKYKVGEVTKCFCTKKEVREVALAIWKTKFPNATCLIEGGWAVLDPCPVLAGPKKLIKASVRICKEWEEIDGYEGNEARAIELSKEWDSLMKELKMRN